MATAAGACAGKTPQAEAERAVAKRCARLAVGTLSTPRPTDANGTGETDETGGSSDDDDDDEDETEKEKKDVDVGVGALAGRGAALALGHLIFSPSTRAVARATVEAARRNAHPSLAGVRGDAFAKAMEVANAASGAASPAAPAERGGAKDRSKTSATVSKPDKESRARADAACNAAVFAALAEGFAAGANAWGGADALRVWTLEAWRDGTSRGRGALLLALRAAVVAADGTPGGAYARDALWALLRETWNAEGGAGTVHADDDSARVETARADDDFDFSSEFATRAVAKGSSAILPALSRAAARAVARSRHVPPDVLERLFVLASTSDDGDGDGDGTFARILADVVDSARDFVAFLAARAASDPNAVAPRVPRIALALLSSRAATRDGITKTQTSTTSGWVLSILVVACAAADPGVRAAGARAVSALAPARRDGKKGVAPAWRALAAAAEKIRGDDTGADARAALAEALAEGFRGDADGSALRETLAPLSRLADETRDGSSSNRAGAYGCRRLVAALEGIGDDVVKATACAPALRWALRGGDGSDPEETMALAVALVEGYAPAAAAEAESGAEDAWRAYLSALDAAAPTPARVAAACRATPEFVDSLPEKARERFFARYSRRRGRTPTPGFARRRGTPRTRYDFARTTFDASSTPPPRTPRVPPRVPIRVPRRVPRRERRRRNARAGDAATRTRATQRRATRAPSPPPSPRSRCSRGNPRRTSRRAKRS